jgi:competence protein ComEC
LRYAITAWIAGGALPFLFAILPANALQMTALALIATASLLLIPVALLRKVAILLMCAFAGLAWSLYFVQQRLQYEFPAALEGVDLQIEGRVDGLPRGDHQGATFAFVITNYTRLPRGVSVNHKTLPRRVYLTWSSAWRESEQIPIIQPGQQWQLRVKFKRPHGVINSHGFDFEQWLFHQGYGAYGSIRSGEKLDQLAPWSFAQWIESHRWNLRDKIKRLLHDNRPYAGVLVALVMGDQNAIDQADWRVFNATGIGHLISISGLHVTMLAGLGALIASRMWRRGSLPLVMPVPRVTAAAGFITAFFYAWIAGFQIPAQRTMYMVGVVAVAVWSGRIPRAFDIWWWALFVVLVLDPMAAYTPGFWLSFGAVAAILYAMGDSSGLIGIPTGKELETSTVARITQALKEACRLQAVVTLALIPCTLYWFYQFSVVSPLANAIAIPLVSYIVTPLAMIGVVMPDALARPLLLLAHTAMEWLTLLLKIMASWDWSVAYSHQPGPILLALSLIGIVVAIRPGPIPKTTGSRLLGCALCACLFIPLKTDLAYSEFQATVLDVGQGTAVLIETQSKRLLYDTGPIQGKKDDAGERIILPFLRGEGIHQIDRMVISHSDSDHVGGAQTLLREIAFDSMLGSLPDHNPLLRTLRQKHIPALPCRYGQSWRWDGVDFLVWHPHEEMNFDASHYGGKPNEMSCVLEVRNRSTSFWLTGDAERDAEAALVQRLRTQPIPRQGRSVVFMAPHHGSKTSSSLDLLRAVNPDWAFTQNGYRNRYNHPHPTVRARYQDLDIPFLQTPNTGAQLWRFGNTSGQKNTPTLLREDRRRIWHDRSGQP